MTRQPFEYAVLRALPRVDRGEFVNVGVMLWCQERDSLAARRHGDAARRDQLTFSVRPMASGSAGAGAVVALVIILVLAAGDGSFALLVLAYDRIGSAWGATAVLLADVLPAMLLGPLLGGVIDRTSRLGVAIVADVIRAVAFAGLVLVDGTVAMVLFALLAGLGTACFRPATYALLPGLALVSIVLTLVLTWRARARRMVFWLYVAAFLLMVAGGVVTRVFNQPINAQVMSWTAESFPANWADLRATWWNWHVLRTGFSVLGFALLLAAIILDRPPYR